MLGAHGEIFPEQSGTSVTWFVFSFDSWGKSLHKKFGAHLAICCAKWHSHHFDHHKPQDVRVSLRFCCFLHSSARIVFTLLVQSVLTIVILSESANTLELSSGKSFLDNFPLENPITYRNSKLQLYDLHMYLCMIVFHFRSYGSYFWLLGRCGPYGWDLFRWNKKPLDETRICFSSFWDMLSRWWNTNDQRYDQSIQIL